MLELEFSLLLRLCQYPKVGISPWSYEIKSLTSGGRGDLIMENLNYDSSQRDF